MVSAKSSTSPFIFKPVGNESITDVTASLIAAIAEPGASITSLTLSAILPMVGNASPTPGIGSPSDGSGQSTPGIGEEGPGLESGPAGPGLGMMGDNAGGKTGANAGGNTGGNTGANAGGNTGDNAGPTPGIGITPIVIAGNTVNIQIEKFIDDLYWMSFEIQFTIRRLYQIWMMVND